MSRRIARRAGAHITSLLVLILCGCSPRYADLDIERIAGAGVVDGDGLEIEEGRVMLIRVRPIAAGVHGYEQFDIVSLESLNSSVVFVEGARHVDEFVVGGVSVGEARILVRVNGYDEDEIFTLVVPQEAP